MKGSVRVSYSLRLCIASVVCHPFFVKMTELHTHAGVDANNRNILVAFCIGFPKFISSEYLQTIGHVLFSFVLTQCP